MDTGEEIFLIDREHVSTSNSSSRGCANLMLKKGHLAEEVIDPQSAQRQLVVISFDKYFDFALLDDEHACARIPLPKDNVAILIFFPQTGHAGALTCIFSAHHSVP